MKKVSRVAVLGIIIAAVVACLGLTGCKTIVVDKSTVSAEKVAEAIEKAKPYSIEQLAPGWMVILLKNDYDWGEYSTERLTEGVKELSKDYEIINIVPVENYYCQGGVTRALMVKVESKH